MKLKLPLSQHSRLVRWANGMRGFYGHPVYLVGSQITGKSNPRDVDIICAIPDSEFSIRFGDANKWIEEGESGVWTEIRWKWSDECIKRWKEGSGYTGMNIDFKVMPLSLHKMFDETNKKYPPYKLDTREE